MTFFSILESFFFLSLGMSFFLILLMVYHFKKRVDSLESKYETLADISKTLYKEIELIRHSHISTMHSQQSLQYSQMNHPKTPLTNEMHDQYPQTFTYLPTDATFISSSSSNQFKELYKKIIISNDILESEPPFLDTEILDDGDIDDVGEKTDDDDAVYDDDDGDDDADDDTYDDDTYDDDTDNDNTDNDEGDIENNNDDTNYDDGIIDDIDLNNDNIEEDNEIENIVIDDLIINTTQLDPIDSVQVIKMEDNDLTEGSILTLEPDNNEQDTVKMSKSALQKMNVQMLRTIAIRDGICDDPSKYKKLELINMIIEVNNVNPSI